MYVPVYVDTVEAVLGHETHKTICKLGAQVGTPSNVAKDWLSVGFCSRWSAAWASRDIGLIMY